MTMRKNTLLIAVAAAALAVGSGTAFAQAPHQGAQKSDSPAVQQNPAAKNAPAEKIQGAEQHKGAASKAETTGQGASERGQRMGQDLDKTKKSTTGQAPSEPKSGQATERPNQKMDQKSEQNSPNNRSTTGQAPTQQTTPNAQRSNEPNRMNSGQTNERSGQTTNERSGQPNERGAADTRGGSASVNLTSEQRTRIHSIIISERSAPRVAHVDFDVHVGTVVPRDRVKLVAVPSTIVEIQPAWRGFEYFLVGDQIVIVDPATLRIVAVVPA
jgi:hypothetical protein